MCTAQKSVLILVFLSSFYLKVVICTRVTFLDEFQQLYLGDSCIVDETNQMGSCKLLENCPLAVRELQETELRVRPTICGYQYKMPIVCCPNTNVIIDKAMILRDRVQPVSRMNGTLEPLQIYNFKHFCPLSDNMNGTVMYEKHCPESKVLLAKGMSLKRLCNYEICNDLVCCPIEQRPRLRQGNEEYNIIPVVCTL